MKERICTVYGLMLDGRCIYVGCTKNPKERFRNHCARLRKMGYSDLKFEVLDRAFLPDARKKERELILKYHKLGQANENRVPFCSARKGGLARSKKLSIEEKKEGAKKAASALWEKIRNGTVQIRK